MWSSVLQPLLQILPSFVTNKSITFLTYLMIAFLLKAGNVRFDDSFSIWSCIKDIITVSRSNVKYKVFNFSFFSING